MRKLSCFLRFHAHEITRKFFWGNVHRAELHCKNCGKRFEGMACDGINVGYVVAAPCPSDIWLAYDQGYFRDGGA